MISEADTAELTHFFQRPALRNVPVFYLPLIPFLRHIEVAVAAPELLDILDPVNARADNVFVFFFLSGSEPAWADHIAVSLLVYREGFQQFKDPLFVGIEKISFF